MRFLMLYKPAGNRAETGALPTEQELAAMGQFIEELTRTGVLLSTEGCQPSAKGARVRLANGKVTVTDGPFAEAKELIAGYAVVQTGTKAEAIELAERFLKVAGDGESEIRQIFEAEDFGPEFTPELREAEERQRARMASNR